MSILFFSPGSGFVCSKLSHRILIIRLPAQIYSGKTKRFDLKGAIFLPFEIKTLKTFFTFSSEDYSQKLAGQLRKVTEKQLLIISLFLSFFSTHQLRSTVFFYQAQ